MKERLLLALLVLTFWFSAVEASGSNKDIFENDDRAIRFQINGKFVYQPVAYIVQPQLTKPLTLTCVPPKEETGGPTTYYTLAIFQGQGDHMETTEICEYPPPPQPRQTSPNQCVADPRGMGSIRVLVSVTSNFTCKYKTNPEPAATPAQIQIYFLTSDTVQAYDENNVSIPIPYKLQKNARPRFVCPGEQADTYVKWYRNDNEEPLKSDSNYEVSNTNYNLTFTPKGDKYMDGSRYGGLYKCERWSKDGKVLIASSFFKINGSAHASPVKPSYNQMQGDTAKMACLIQGEPTPTVRWERRKDGNSTDLAKDERVKFGAYKGVPNAAIEIKDLKEEDYGNYACIADNGLAPQHQHAEAEILLRVRSRLAALWPFLGIVAEVIILVAIIFIYEKRRMKKEQDDTEDTIDAKKSLTAANNESKDIRQRKA